jgi:hypothetical protein
MGKSFNKTVIIVIGVFLVLIISAAAFTTQNPSKIVQNPTPTIVSENIAEAKQDTITYDGEEGKDALTLLKNIANVEQNSSGLVTGIDGRAAAESKKEYWAFYVNGEMAPVGPAEYQTKNEDKIEWKIETY